MGGAGNADTSVARRIDNPSYLRTRRRKSGVAPCAQAFPAARAGARVPGAVSSRLLRMFVRARPRGTAPRDPPRPPKAPKNRPKPAKTGQNRPKPKKPAKTGMPHDAWKPAKPPRPAKDGQKSGQNRLKSAKIGHGQRAPHRHGPRPGPRRRRVRPPEPRGPPEYPSASRAAAPPTPRYTPKSPPRQPAAWPRRVRLGACATGIASPGAG